MTAKDALHTALAFVERTTHWQEGKPDRHDALVALRAAMTPQVQAMPELPVPDCVFMDCFGGPLRAYSEQRLWAIITYAESLQVQLEAARAALVLAKHAIQAAHEQSDDAELHYGYEHTLRQIDAALSNHTPTKEQSK